MLSCFGYESGTWYQVHCTFLAMHDWWRNRIKFHSSSMRGSHAFNEPISDQCFGGYYCRQCIFNDSFSHSYSCTLWWVLYYCSIKQSCRLKINSRGRRSGIFFTAKKYAKFDQECQRVSRFILKGILVLTPSMSATCDSSHLALRTRTLVYWLNSLGTLTRKKDINMKTLRSSAIRFVCFKKRGRDRESDSMTCMNLTYRSRI